MIFNEIRFLELGLIVACAQANRFGMDWPKEVLVVYSCLVGLTKLEAQRQFLNLLSKKAYGKLLPNFI